jgi:thiol-disulfide isomerase/thioredoxin
MNRLTITTWSMFSLLVLTIGATWIWLSVTPLSSTTQGDIPAPQEGFLAPDFRLETFGRDGYTLSELRGKPVLINFWASWCTPCRSEMPAIQQVYEEFQDQGFVVLAVNSTHQDNLGDAITFAQIRKLTFPILLDKDGSVSDLYEVRALPTTFFVDPQGIIQEVVIGGPMSEALLQIRVEQLMEQSP